MKRADMKHMQHQGYKIKNEMILRVKRGRRSSTMVNPGSLRKAH